MYTYTSREREREREREEDNIYICMFIQGCKHRMGERDRVGPFTGKPSGALGLQEDHANTMSYAACMHTYMNRYLSLSELFVIYGVFPTTDCIRYDTYR